MGRPGQNSTSDTSIDSPRKAAPEAPKVRTKKKKRKRIVTNLRQKLSKGKKHKWRQSNFVKLVADFADLRKEYEDRTKIDGKPSKTRKKKKLANRILPKPLAGIYKNGAIGKEIRKSHIAPAMGDTDNARLEGNVRKLLHGYESKSEKDVEGNTNENTRQSTSKDIIPYSSDESTSSCKGRMDGGKVYKKPEESKAIEISQKSSDNNVGSTEYQEKALQRYQELCQKICSENFDDFPDNFPAADPLTTVKKKLRSSYAESFRFQFMRDTLRRGVATSSTASSTDMPHPPSDNQNIPFLFTADDVQKQRNKKDQTLDNLQEHRDKLLFDYSGISGGSSNLIETETRNEINESNGTCSSVEVNCNTSSILRNNKDLKLFEMATNDKSNLFVLEQRKSANRKHTRKERAPHMYVVSSKLKKYSGVQNLKAQHQMKLKNLKHVPSILRKGKDVDNCWQGVFDKAPHVNKKMLFEPGDVLFTPPSATSDATSFHPENTELCVVASPSASKSDLYLIEKIENRKTNMKPQASEDIFIKKKKPVQKTVMFTKKDSMNAGRCVHMNNVTNNEKRENPNVCIIRKNVSQCENVCNVHRNCQRIPGTCYRELKCSQNSELSQPNCSSQKFHDSQNSLISEDEVVIRRMHNCDHRCNDVCYVVLDQCKHGNTQECLCNNRARQLQGQLYQENIGILNGVENLKLIRSQSQELHEQPPIKYLAFEEDSKTRKIPVYMQNKRDVEVIDPGVNYRLVSCPQKPANEVILVPTCESKKVLYVKQNAPNVPHSKLVLVEDPSNVCGIHAPKQNVMEIRNPEYNVVTNLADNNNKRRLKWEESYYRPDHGHDGCLQKQTIFYQK